MRIALRECERLAKLPEAEAKGRPVFCDDDVPGLGVRLNGEGRIRRDPAGMRGLASLEGGREAEERYTAERIIGLLRLDQNSLCAGAVYSTRLHCP